MNILSLFDGISCARVSLDRVGIKVNKYYACEIDKHAIKISQKNYPEIVQLGDVREVHTVDEPIDLLIGGSPCQDLSIAKKDRKGLEGERSSLFWEYIRIKDLVKPKWFILENVASMPKRDKDTITKTIGVEPILIDASLVSAQSRKRLFWTNIPINGLPQDRGILLKDILQPDADVEEEMTIKGKSFCLTATYHKTGENQNEYEHNKARKQRTMVKRVGRDIGRRLNAEGHREDNNTDLPIQRRIELRDDEKCGTLTSVMKDNLIVSPVGIRKLTPIECERLQSLPDNYTEGIAKTHRYKCLGNAFNVEVIAHILSGKNFCL